MTEQKIHSVKEGQAALDHTAGFCQYDRKIVSSDLSDGKRN